MALELMDTTAGLLLARFNKMRRERPATGVRLGCSIIGPLYALGYLFVLCRAVEQSNVAARIIRWVSQPLDESCEYAMVHPFVHKDSTN
eukprot:scaffold151285_cov49-Attheya_sp.AAC.1